MLDGISTLILLVLLLIQQVFRVLLLHLERAYLSRRFSVIVYWVIAFVLGSACVILLRFGYIAPIDTQAEEPWLGVLCIFLAVWLLGWSCTSFEARE